MTDPFYPAKPGDPISAEKWNDMQVKLRDELSNRISVHAHTGGAEGRKLTGDGIDPTSILKVNQLDAAVSLSVKNIDVLGRLNTLDQQKFAVTGGGITGSLSVSGNVGIGTTTPPVARLDIQGAARSGTHAQTRVLYVTGEFGEADGVEFRHSNGTQGLGLGFNTLYAAGSNPNQDLKLKARGTGTVQVLNTLQALGLFQVSSAGGALARIEAGGSGGWAELDLYSTFNAADQRKWNLAARGDGGFNIRLLTDARQEKSIPLSIHPNGTVSVKSLTVTGDTIDGKVTSLYVSGNFGPAENGVEFRHSNATQGIGFGHNTIYATGSNADQELGLQARGNAYVKVVRSLTTEGRIVFLELFQSQGAGNIFPSLRFHHAGRHWSRIEARAERLHFMTGDTNSDGYIDAAARSFYVGGLYPAAGCPEQVRLLRGFVNAGGGTRGAGFSARWIGSGVCEITFNNQYGDAPSVIATQEYVGSGNMGADTRDNAVVTGVWNNRARVKTGDGNGNGTNRDFHFIVMGA